ncbi:MAG: carbohydrate ABC transporter permease [Anaerolineae bacterium]|jgi:trehalose/maltose transport system permease protein
MNENVQNAVRRILFFLLLFLIFVYLVFPFYWAINSSLKTETELQRTPATLFPDNPTLINYQAIFRNDRFTRALLNSVIVAVSTTALCLVVGSFGAFALGKLRFRGKTPSLYIILAMTMFPQIAVLSGLYAVISRLNLHPLPSMILSYMIFTMPFTVWVMTSFFKALPTEIMQSAQVDGATPFQTFYMILLPLTAPALVTTGLLAFIAAWNEYLFALTFTIISPQNRTVPVAIASFTGEIAHQEPFGEIMAASVVVTVPLLILVLVFQQRIVAGLTAGAVKG